MKKYNIKSGFFERERTLILAENYVEYESRNPKGTKLTRLNKSDIADFRHGMDWIVWYRFTAGRQFSISFKDKANRELRILFNSHFGLHRQNDQLYADIVDDIWRYYHADIVDGFLQKFYSNVTLVLQGITLMKEGVQLRGKHSVLPWDKVSIKEYYGYFAIYNKENAEVHSRVSYNEYETESLWGVLQAILKKEK